MKAPIYTQKGKKSTKTVELSDLVFSSPINVGLLSQYVYVYLSNQREPIAHTKTRAHVRGGGRKPWKQKGTGNARAGSIRSPIWRGGGITFGPLSTRNWKKGLNKKSKVVAIRSAFSKLVQDDKLKVVDSIEFKDGKLTKQALELVKGFGNARKTLIVTAERLDNVIRAFANVPSVKVIRVGELNTYELMNAGEVLILQDALEYVGHWAKTSAAKSTKEEETKKPKKVTGSTKAKKVKN